MERRWLWDGRRRSSGRRMIHDRRRQRGSVIAERRSGHDQRSRQDRRRADERRLRMGLARGALTH